MDKILEKLLKKINELDNTHSDQYLSYNRKSTDDADNQKNSVAYQVGESIQYAERENLKIANIELDGFCEVGIIREHHSGFATNAGFELSANGSITQQIDRPKFMVMVEALKKKKFKGVIILCWDRASRNDLDDSLIKKLIDLGVDIRFVQTKYDTSSSGKLHMDIDGMFSKHYSRVISEKVTNTRNKLVSEGKVPHRVKLGYLNRGSDNKPFDPIKAPIVKRMFEMYATGEWSYTELAKWANLQGLTCEPARRKRTKLEKMKGVELSEIPKTSKPITLKTVEMLLNSPFYIGKNLHNGKYVDSTAHSPLIDTALFYKVKSVMASRTQSVHYLDKQFYSFREMLRCTACNRAYSPYVKKGITYYGSKCKADCTNIEKNTSEAKIVQKLKEVLDKISFSDQELLELEKNSHKELNKVAERRDAELQDTYRQLSKAVSDLDYLSKEKLTMLRNSIMTPENILKEEIRLTAIIAELKTKIHANVDSTQEMLSYVILFSDLVKQAGSIFENGLDSHRHKIITKVFSELYLYNGKLEYVAKQGFDRLLDRVKVDFTNDGGPTRNRTLTNGFGGRRTTTIL